MNAKGLFLGIGVVALASVVAFALKGDGRGDEALPEEAPAEEVAADAVLEDVPELPVADTSGEPNLMVEPDEIAQAILDSGDFPPLGEVEQIVHDDGSVTIKKHIKAIDMATGEVTWKPTVMRAHPVRRPMKFARRNVPNVVSTDQPAAGPEVPTEAEEAEASSDDGR